MSRRLLLPAIVVAAAVAAGASPQQSAPDVAGLVRQLQSADPWAREAARLALVTTSDAAAVPPLVAVLESREANGRVVAIVLEALGNFTDARKIPALMDRARREPALRERIGVQMTALGQLAVPVLQTEITTCRAITKWDAVRGWAADTLGTMREAGVDALVRLSRDGSGCRRAYAVAGLQRAADEPRVAETIRRTLEDPDWWVRNTAFDVVAGLLGPEGEAQGNFDFAPLVGPLTRRLRAREDAASRTDIVEMLEKIGDPRAAGALRRLLRDPDDEIRDAADRAMKTLAPPRDPLRAISPQLRSTDPAVRIRGIEALADLETNETARVIPFLQDRNAAVRRAAAEALGAINYWSDDPGDENQRDESAVDPLVAALGDGSVEVRVAAAEALGRMAHVFAIDGLASALADRDTRVVQAAVRALGAVQHPDGGPPLATLYRTSDAATRRLVLAALWEVCDPRTTPVLLEALRDPVLRDGAASALGCLFEKRREDLLAAGLPPAAPPRPVVDALLEALADTKKPSFPFLEAVGETRDPRAVPLLSKLAGEGGETRAWALSTLGRIDDTAAVPTLVAALGDPQPGNRLAAAAALADLHDFAVTPEMIDALVDEDMDVRGWAATALARSRDSRAVAPLIRALDVFSADRREISNGKSSRRSVIAALGVTKAPGAVEPLVAYMLDARNPVDDRGLAAGALGNHGDPRAIPALVSLLDQPTSPLTAEAASALGYLGDARGIAPLRAAEQRLAAQQGPDAAKALDAVRAALKRLVRGN